MPGAFTETCTNLHVPGYIANYEMFKAKGVNDIYIIGVNDVFVMQFVSLFLHFAWYLDNDIAQSVEE